MLTVNESPIKNHAKEKLVAELKHLEWYKMANESALKAALKQARSYKISNSRSKLDSIEFHNEINIKRKAVKSDPVEVQRNFVFEVEKNETTNNAKLSNQIELHINVLNRLRAKLDEQEEVKMRSHQYREWKKEFSKKKEFVMEGNKIENYTSQQIPEVRLQMNEYQDIPDSLRKLAELEARISVFESACNATSNESDTVYEKLVMFQKQHRPLKGARDNDKHSWYSVIGRKTSRYDEKKGHTFKPKFAQHYLDKATIDKKRLLPSKKKGFFLTECDNEYNDDEIDRDSILKENRRKVAMASDGQKNLRMRIQQRKARVNALPYARSNRKGDDLKRTIIPSSMARAAGASTGNKSNNRYLNEFERIKTEYTRKREESKMKTGILNNKSHDSSRPNKNYLNINILNERMDNHNLLMSQSAGSVTRKVDSNSLPLRRPVSMSFNNQQNLTTSFSVLGVNGIRKLKNK